MFQRSSLEKVFVKRDRSEAGVNTIGSVNKRRGVGVADHNYHRPKEDESIDLIMKKAGFSIAVKGNTRFGSANKRKFPPSCGSKVKPLSVEESIKLLATQSRTTSLCTRSSTYIKRNTFLAKATQKQRNSPEKKKKTLSNANALRTTTQKPTQQNQIVKDLSPSPREKVLNVLSLFHLVFKELERDKASRRGETNIAMSNIDYKTRAVLVSKGMQMNRQKRIGPVQGIKIGDEFRYKSELNLIGLHLGIMGGIDYMYKGGLQLATSIVSSEGSGYNDIVESNVLIYSGEGGNVKGKDEKKVVEDQKLVNGNLALANSMREESPVRVIYGKMRSDQRGKTYFYDGLYLVKDYWKEQGPKGNILFKFKLSRIRAQPFVNWRH